eukprot:TRINITY_DN24371_c0_g1_i1.p1 TRINITY_DN24371_c0_g1~~TRINITY_DN24371_c0_g1_i1.p1  ORF type:complete len:655 (+),score=109.81 TRINITY_DN24371_c0_g1_i1:198-2162(+)
MKVGPNTNAPRAKENLPFKVSETHDQLDNGPVEERGCTDICCCLLFIAFAIGLAIIAGYAFQNGQPKYLTAVYDADRNACGFESAKDYPYLYFPRPILGYLNQSVCVQKCPNYTLDTQAPKAVDCLTNTFVKNCTVNYGLDTVDWKNPSFDFGSMFLIYNTTLYLKRICFPSGVAFWANVNVSSTATKFFDSLDTMNDWISDVKLVWPIFFAVAGIAFLIGFVFMFVMRYCSGCMTWLMIWLFLFSLAGLGYVCYAKAKSLETAGVAAATQYVNTPTTQGVNDQSSDPQANSRRTLYGLAIALWVLDGVALIGLCCIYHKINLAIAILKAGADYMKSTPQVLVVPPIMIATTILFCSYWIVIFVNLYAVGDFHVKGTNALASVKWDTTTRNAVYYHSFGFLWGLGFLIALTQFILASTTAIWYYAQGQDGQGAHRPVSRSFYRAFRYHLGSIAFGSLILAIVQAIKLILAYISAKAKETGMTKNNKFVEYAIAAMNCLVNCFERFIQYLNKNAYIQIAIRGTTFCQAARDAFYMMWKNPVRFAVMAGLGEAYLFVGKLFIVFITTAIGYGLITNIPDYKDDLNSPILPSILFICISYVIGLMFMSVYGMACDTIMQCFCTDEENQKEKGREPKHAPEVLKEFFAKVEADHTPSQ